MRARPGILGNAAIPRLGMVRFFTIATEKHNEGEVMDPYTLECPHCHTTWTVHPDDELCHADDVADGIETTCEECGGKYELTTRAEVYFTATAVENR